MSQSRRPELFVIFLTIFVSMVGFGIVIPVLPDYGRNEPFRMSATSLGWLTGIFSLVQLFTAPLLGRWSDRIGRRPVLLLSTLGSALGYFVTGAAGAPWMLFLGRIIDGASGGNVAAAQACIADMTKPEERAKYMGMIGAAFGFGFMLGPALGGVLSLWHHSAPFYFAGVLALVNAWFIKTRLPETLTPEKRLHPSTPAPLAEVFAGGRGRTVSLLLLAGLLSTTGFAFVHLLFSLFCGDHLGYSRAEMSFAFAYIGLLGIVVQGGLIRRLMKRPIEKPLILIGALMMAASLWLLPRVHGTPGFLGVTALMALGNGLIVPTLTGLLSRSASGHAQGRALGLNAAAGSLGRFLGPMLAALPLPLGFSEFARPLAGGTLQAVELGYRTSFTWAAWFLVAAAVTAALVVPPRPATPVPPV
jgi:DHA1 family tetracycline resistance protein-like MFS transporter